MDNYLDLRKSKNILKLKEASNIIKQGGLVLFPTETVYGIGADGLNESAVNNIFKAKGRAPDNPLILHICDLEMLNNIAKDVTNIEMDLMKAFWPGPFTIVLKRKQNVPNAVTGGLDTVAIRMPSGEIARTLIKLSGTPIAAPSANISGRPSGTSVQDVYDELKDKMNYIIDGGPCEVGIESTVVKVENNKVIILRPGKITKEEIEKVVASVVIDKNVLGSLDKEQKVLSPGMKYKHYAPKSKCLLIYSKNNNEMIRKIHSIALGYSNPVVICKGSNINKYEKISCISYGNDLDEIAKNIFNILRKIDKICPDIVLIEGVKQEGLGLAIMNRLIRACSHNYIEI